MRRKPSAISEGGAFKTLYLEQRDSLIRYFARRVVEPQLAIELCAETFAQAFVDRRSFRGTEHEQAIAWLYTIGSRKLIDYYRRGAAEQKALHRLSIELPAPQAEELERVEELADLRTARLAIREGLERLNDQEQLALQLRIVEEKPYPVVAMRLGVSEQTARTRVSRALRALGEIVELDPLIRELT